MFNRIMFKYLRSWRVVSVETFWRRLITVLLCQSALVFTFVQYQANVHHTIIFAETSLEPRRQAIVPRYQNGSMDVESNRNSINVTSANSSVNLVSNHTKLDLPVCPLVPPDLKGEISVDMTVYSEIELATRLPLLKDGGTFQPSSCVPRHKVAIIIPYRNRRTHLQILLNNLHPFLQKQQLEYSIFVIELAPHIDFNKALSMNIGVLEAIKYGFDCFIFHDVDLIPENDNNMYTCPDNPKHMSVAIDKFDYELPYVKLFGGVTAMKKEQFEAVNGYSNKYFGWGAEDDDMYARIRSVGLAVTRYTSDVSTYRMLHHPPGSRNEHRHWLLETGIDRWKNDGINTIKYKVLLTVRKRLYTYILADINQEDSIYKMEAPSKLNINKPVRLIDEKVEELLIEKAKHLLNTNRLDPRVKHMLCFEFFLSRSSTVTTEHVAGILRRILPDFRWSEGAMKKVNNYRQQQRFPSSNKTMHPFESNLKDDVFSNIKMSLMINNFNENMKKMMQKSFEDQRLMSKLFKHH